ncbi:MAG: radical SAM protein, partial [Lachnospiraceae bacterium]|nr:radical SAM protein [Lachnospiraceae bacterium]
NVIFGGAGPGRLRENALATAEIVNKTTPYLIFTGTIHADPGCPLYDDIQSGRFIEPTLGEHIDEEELFLEKLELENCLYFGLHPSNVVRMQGWLPRDKEAMLEEVRKTRTRLAGRLNDRPFRYGEGAIALL